MEHQLPYDFLRLTPLAQGLPLDFSCTDLFLQANSQRSELWLLQSASALACHRGAVQACLPSCSSDCCSGCQLHSVLAVCHWRTQAGARPALPGHTAKRTLCLCAAQLLCLWLRQQAHGPAARVQQICRVRRGRGEAADVLADVARLEVRARGGV